MAESKNNTTNKRDDNPNSETFGLIKNIDYKLDEFGFIDWRSLIPKQFLFPNSEKFKSLGKEVPNNIDNLDDSMILIKLGGIKWLARLRGYESVSFDFVSHDPNPIVKCTIQWIPNFENPFGVNYQEIASCNPKNSDDISLKFAESIAANRSFVRCVRNFLNINIVGEEEIFNKNIENDIKNDESKNSSMSIDPQSIFLKICKEKGMSLDQIIKFCSKSDDSLKDIEKNVNSDASLIQHLDPKIAKKLLKEIKKV